jgi:hypothetical protein
LREPWDLILDSDETLKGFDLRGTLFRVGLNHGDPIPGLSLRSNPGLGLANAFGVIKQAEISERLRRNFLMHYRICLLFTVQ